MTTGAEENRIARVELVDEMRATARRMRECAERMNKNLGNGVCVTDAYALHLGSVNLEDAAESVGIGRRKA
jgi:hypothetical protein